MIFKETVIKPKPFVTFQNVLSLIIVVSSFIYLFIGDRREFTTGLITLCAVVFLMNIFLGLLSCKDEEIKQLHLEAKNLALDISGKFIDNAATKETRVDTIRTDNISGSIVADKLIVDEPKIIKDDTK